MEKIMSQENNKITDLKEYLAIVVDMEKNVFIQKQAIMEMENLIDSLAIPLPEVKAKAAEPSRDILNREETKFKFKLFGVVVFCVWYAYNFLLVWSDYSVTGIEVSGWDLLLVWILILFLIISWNAFKDKKRTYDEMCELLNESHAVSVRAHKLLKEKFYKEEQYKKILQFELQKLKEKNIESLSILESIYSKNIIFPKYRNLVSVTYIYEYLRSRRCESLEGHEGAYNILEMELRMDRIDKKMDKALLKLDDIKSSQYVLYSGIQEANKISKDLSTSVNKLFETTQDIKLSLIDQTNYLNEITKSSAITAYNTERSRIELNYMNRMNYLSGNYDNVYFNLPHDNM